MAATLVQSNNASTTVNSPASVTPTLGVASTAGNDLLISIAVTGTSPTITTPTNWTVVTSFATAAFALGIFMLPRNAGGITSVAITISATNGGASASIFEFAGEGIPFVIDTPNTSINSATANQFVSSYGKENQSGELHFVIVGFVATTTIASTNNTNIFSGNVSGGTSTTATTNVTIANYWGIGGVSFPVQVVVNLNASVVGMLGFTAFISNASSPITYDTIGGQQGVYVGQFNQGMIGG